MGEDIQHPGVVGEEPRMNKRDEYLQIFSHLLNDYSDKQPGEIVKSNNKPLHKVRNAWFMTVIGEAENAVDAGLTLSSKTREHLRQMIDKYCTGEFHGRLTRREDIDDVNQFIREVISDIQ